MVNSFDVCNIGIEIFEKNSSIEISYSYLSITSSTSSIIIESIDE